MNKRNNRKTEKKYADSGSKFAVRLICFVLAGLMVLGGITTLLLYLFQ